MKNWTMKSGSWICVVSRACFAISPALCLANEELRKRWSIGNVTAMTYGTGITCLTVVRILAGAQKSESCRDL
jgi:hypothetical protein